MLTKSDLMALWRAMADESYVRPLQDAAARGQDAGLELYEMAAEVLARVAELIDRNTQAMYVNPHSGQSGAPAAGASRARVNVHVTRSKAFEQPILLGAGQFVVEQVLTDYGPDGGIEVATGRAYAATQAVALMPGDSSAILPCESLHAGYGGNFAPPGTLSRVRQRGAGYQNDGASVEPGVQVHRLIVAPNADVVTPDLVGHYLVIYRGLNAGRVMRVIGYEEPIDRVHGGIALLAADGVYLVGDVIGEFKVGEEVTQANGARAVFRGIGNGRMMLTRLAGDVVAGQDVVGIMSGASAPVESVDVSPGLIAEQRSVSWRVLEWAADFGLEVVNEQWPSGGASAMLDEIGEWRGVTRSPGEDDPSYRRKVAAKADVVTPNAIRRVANRVLSQHAMHAVLREVGYASLPGLYFDGDPSSTDPAVAFAFDLDPAQRPADAIKVLLDYVEMRAFFVLGVQRSGLGDFGAAFDANMPSNAFDAAPHNCFFDGWPITTARLQQALWAAANAAKAAGVTMDLWLEPSA